MRKQSERCFRSKSRLLLWVPKWGSNGSSASLSVFCCLTMKIIALKPRPSKSPKFQTETQRRGVSIWRVWRTGSSSGAPQSATLLSRRPRCPRRPSMPARGRTAEAGGGGGETCLQSFQRRFWDFDREVENLISLPSFSIREGRLLRLRGTSARGVDQMKKVGFF